ncbi:MAG TPA: EF-hand domain-containing protein [Polyangiaceae bacterium]|nr:EF-hand domain-containing protein [Polyangiaceae bacterium]
MQGTRESPAQRRLTRLLDDCFQRLAAGKQGLSHADLKRALELRSDFLVERMFVMLDRDGNGSISLDEYRAAAQQLLHGTPEDKIRLSFRVHDLDGDGRIDANEFRRMVRLNLLEERERTGAALDPDSICDALARRLFLTVDENNDSTVSYEEFERMALAEHALLELASRTEARWLIGGPELLDGPAERLGYWRRVAGLLENHRAWLCFMALWVVGNLALVARALFVYRECGAAMMVARAAGASLNLNSALILLSVMRGLATKMRGLRLAPLLPLDDSLAIHRLLGYSIAAGATLHSAAHVVNNLGALRRACAAITHPISDFTRPSGWGLLLFTAVMVGFALPQIRRSKYFHWFATAHLLYLPWFGLALVHAPHLRLWVLLPVVVFALELGLRTRRRSRVCQQAELTPLSSKVSRIRLPTPPHFKYRAGDYALLKIPCLASLEWHPFTISSAPESGELTFHIRALGSWTEALFSLAERRHQQGQTAPIAVHLDGPYGSPSAHALSQRHAVLIGAGIGVTPFASVLDSLVTRANQGDLELEKLYFYWVSGDPRSFEWFKDLLLELEQKDSRALVEIRIFLSRARASLAAHALNLARNLAHDVGKPDEFTGLRAQTRVGEPDFEQELCEIAARHAPDKVEVFYCGRPELGRKLGEICLRLGLSFRPEPF